MSESTGPKHNVVKLDLNVTNRCNLNCKHCCFKSCIDTKMPEFSFEEISYLLGEFIALGGKRIDITGGEPMMRGDIAQIIGLCTRLGIKTELVSNATMLSVSLLKHFKSLGLNQLAVSIDGSTHAMHSFIRGVKPIVYEGVKYIIKSAASLGYYTKVNTVVFGHNLKDIADITRLAIDLGAREHGLYFFSPVGRGQAHHNLFADPVAWLRVIRERLTAFSGKIDLSIEVPMLETPLAERLNAKCYLKDPWHLQFLPDGKVYPCAIMAALGKNLAHFPSKSLKAIWGNPELWNDGFYERNVAPRIKEFGSCVNYPQFSHLIKSDRYHFACLCNKFTLEEICG